MPTAPKPHQQIIERVEDLYQQLVNEVAEKIQPPVAENYNPVLTMPLTVHNGITITGTLETNDDTVEGRLSYVTVLRDSNSADPSNGYGFAWMKGDGSKYNIYLVDNSALANDLFISSNFIVNPQGENTWKAATRFVLTPTSDSTPKVYNFKLAIGVDYSMDLRLWEVGSSEPTLPTVSCGAPRNGPSAIGTHFGYGIIGTNNCAWWYDDLIITRSNGIHTAVLYKFKAPTSLFPNSSQAALEHYGYGHDGVPSSTNWGLSTFIRQKVNGDWTWTDMGSNSSTDISTISSTKIRKVFTIDTTTRDGDNFVQMLATSTFADTDVTEVSSYYTKLETLLPSGVHTGGCSDIYINDPPNILIASTSINNNSGTIPLTEANGFFIPLHSIVQVTTDLIGDELIPNQDYTLVSPYQAFVFSTSEAPYLSINPAYLNFKLRIVYRYYKNGTNVQTLLDSDDYRFAGTSNIAKVMPPVIVTINNLTFRGTPSELDIRTAIKDYINSSTKSISLSDLLNTVYAAGVAWIDVANADIKVTSYDFNRVVLDPTPLTSSYTLDNLQAFFSDDTSLAGVHKL